MSNTSMTIGEFVEYVETFEYSKEYFDLVKQISEITLMETYLNSYNFYMENSNSNCNFNHLITEGIGDIVNKIGRGIKWLVEKILDLLWKGLCAIYRGLKWLWNKIKDIGSDEVPNIIIEAPAIGKDINKILDNIDSLIKTIKREEADIKSIEFDSSILTNLSERIDKAVNAPNKRISAGLLETNMSLIKSEIEMIDAKKTRINAVIEIDFDKHDTRVAQINSILGQLLPVVVKFNKACADALNKVNEKFKNVQK